MLGFLRDTWRSANLRAKYRRLVQEQLLAIVEMSGPQPVSEDPGRWSLLGDAKSSPGEPTRVDQRTQARLLVRSNPYARNVLRLLEVYVAGPGMMVTAAPAEPHSAADILLRTCDRLWQQFLRANRRHFTFAETTRRTWRDGECFLRLFPQTAWPPTVRYVDPELIGATAADPDSQGMVSDPDDVERVLSYLQIDPTTGELQSEIAADEMLHIKIGVDSNERRGVTIFASVLDSLMCFDKWLDTEIHARKLQASIVLWRKVQGSPTQVTATADAAQTLIPGDSGAVRRERYRPGTILTTSHSTDLQFLQPNTNFSDAVPLGRLVLLGIAAGAGVPEYMLSSDAANANYASTMVAEGPAVKLFESEQQFFANELCLLWMWVLGEATSLGLLPADTLDRVTPHWSFPQLVNRDRAKERLADLKLAEAGVLSRAEIARRDNVDPVAMQSEIAAERGV
ncbi:MAG: phage portal protein [Planctomycetaceae bacterium]|nr:phage portal protein [Planctomycetaceae bacterium]